MIFLLARLLVMLYGAGFILFILTNLSRTIFGRHRFLAKVGRFFKLLAYTLIWPVMFFSSGGQKAFDKFLKEF